MPEDPVKARILVIEDDRTTLYFTTTFLSRSGFDVQGAKSVSEGLELVKSFCPHVVLLDMELPEKAGGMFMLESVRQRSTDYVSVIFVTGRSDLDDVIAGLDAGADDYIPKPYEQGELLARVKAQVRLKDIRDQLKSANEKLQKLSETDDLTGLLNMRTIYQRIDHELQRSRRYQRSVSAVMMDMDRFKTVNDNHDHLFGSFVLKEIGKIITENVRSIDFAARYGGDEYLIVLTETDKKGAQTFCERLRMTIAERAFDSGTDHIQLTASLGAAVTDPKAKAIDAKSLVRAADAALYMAKGEGRNCTCLCDVSTGVPSKVSPASGVS